MLYSRVLGMLGNAEYEMLIDSEWLGYLKEGIGYLPKENRFRGKPNAALNVGNPIICCPRWAMTGAA